MIYSLNHGALALVDRLLEEAEIAKVQSTILENGARVIDCGAGVAGGLRAGQLYAEICMGALGSVSFAPLMLEELWLPALTVFTDHPALACLASQYAGWRIDRDGWFAMASGPGRSLVRAEELYGDLDCEEHATVAVFCLETRKLPPAAVAAYIAERAGVQTDALTLLLAPTASLVGSVQIAARVVETALHKLHELGFDVRRVLSGIGCCPLAPVAGGDLEAIGRTNDAVLYGGQVQLTVDADDEQLSELAHRLPASASPDYGQEFGRVLERAGFDFYKIDPLLFSPAQVTLTSTASGRSFTGGAINLDVLKRSFAL
jgi:methenyltetrahydromethanopterin cyclohydrolase